MILKFFFQKINNNLKKEIIEFKNFHFKEKQFVQQERQVNYH